jgi:hypothetical protein
MIRYAHWLLASFALLCASSAYAQSFTYQGFLRQSGSPVNGSLSMTFRLYSVPTGGSPLGTVGPVSVSVSNGLFTRELDFGSVWDGSDRWLEIQVGSTTLSPRVKITPTPYAIRANTAGTANPIGAAGGDLSGSYPNPTVARLQGRSVANTAPSNGDVLKWNGTAWAPATDLRDAFWQQSGSNIFYNAGNVGIGTSSPSYPLTVSVSTASDRAIYAFHSATSGTTLGVHAITLSTSGTGVLGNADATSGFTIGVRGTNQSSSGAGVWGQAFATTGTASGVYGESRSPTGVGVYGQAEATTGVNYGVFGRTNSPSGYAGYFEGRGYFSANVGIGVTNPSARLQVSTNTGADAVRIDHMGSGRGLQVQASSDTAIWGITQTGFAGVDGRGQTRGVYGLATGTAGTTYGIVGESPTTNGRGVYGLSTATSGTNYGVYGETNSRNGVGVFGRVNATTGVNFGGHFEHNSTDGAAVLGIANATSGYTFGGRFENSSPDGVAVWGFATATSGTNTGIRGRTSSPDGTAIEGRATATTGVNIGVYGSTSSTSGYAGYFSGRVHVNGTLSKSAGSFKIDHPLDPENKYLVHSFVESPDMMNIYNGNVTTDARGYAVVTLPEWFEVLNTDFRYQLTVIGQFAQAIVAQEIRNNQFVIRTDKPNVKVSWQVTGVRKDPYAQQHRIPVEEWKLPEHRGKYLHPELYGQPKERGIHYRPEFESPAEFRKP